MKLKRHKMKMYKLEDVDKETTFSGVGKTTGKAKWLVPIAIRFKESRMVVHGTMESCELEGDSRHLMLFSQQQQAQFGFLKCMRIGTMTVSYTHLTLPTKA